MFNGRGVEKPERQDSKCVKGLISRPYTLIQRESMRSLRSKRHLQAVPLRTKDPVGLLGSREPLCKRLIFTGDQSEQRVDRCERWVSLEVSPRDDSERPTAASKSPEEVGIVTSVGGVFLAIYCDNVNLEYILKMSQ
jgi:hypothetical protein